MKQAQLSWRRASTIAVRELRSAIGRFAFVVVAVGLGVGALTGVRGFSAAFRGMLLSQARGLMAGDIALSAPTAEMITPSPAQQAALASLARRGADSTLITESVSMVARPAAPEGQPPVPVLVTLKAVDPAKYPYNGSVATTPPNLLPRLDDAAVMASPDLLLRLDLQAGAPIEIAGQTFTILGRDDAEPDRLEGGLSVGPRLLLTQGGLKRTGIMQLGSQISARRVFRLTPGAPPVAAVEAELRRTFPRARINDFRNANPTVENGLNHATTFLSLISLIALVVGALGVASAMQAHLQLRLDAIATMKVLGARTSQILRIYGLQTLLLGLAGGLVGVGLSAGVERVFPRLLAIWFPNLPPVGWSWPAAAAGLAAGVLITLLFTLPTLLGLRRVRPAVILRRHMDEAAPPAGERLRRWVERLVCGAVLLTGIAVLAVGLSDEPWRAALRLGAYFLVALGVGIAALALVTWVLLRLLRLVVRGWNRAYRRPPIALRQGLANLYRPGVPTLAVLVTLGIGVMFTLTIFLLQRALLADLRLSTPPGVANVFLIDVPPQQQQAVLALVQKQAGLESAPELLAIAQVRLGEINGARPRFPRRSEGGGRGAVGWMRGPLRLSPAVAAPAGATITAGAWWSEEPPATAPEAAVSDTLSWQPGPGASSFITRVAAIYRPAPQRLSARVDAFISPGPLDALPATVNGGVRIAPAQIPQFESALYRAFPAITVVNLADVIERVQQVVDQITLVVHFVSLFAVLAGAIILASSVAGTRFRRMREIAVLKTLGATRGRVIRIFTTEFALLGMVAGGAGGLLAWGFTWVITRRLLTVAFHGDAMAVVYAVAATAAVAVIAGWLASARILNLHPLEVLRGE